MASNNQSPTERGEWQAQPRQPAAAVTAPPVEALTAPEMGASNAKAGRKKGLKSRSMSQLPLGHDYRNVPAAAVSAAKVKFGEELKQLRAEGVLATPVERADKPSVKVRTRHNPSSTRPQYPLLPLLLGPDRDELSTALGAM